MGLLGDVFGSVPGLGMVTDAIGTIGNIYSQAKANSTNKKLVRETNAQNYKMFQENLQNQWDMWNATNAYNDPSAQRERLQAAGLNPWLMMNGANAGNAQGAITPTAPTAQAPHVDPVDTSGLGSPFRTYMELDQSLRQSRLTEAQIQGQQRQNEHDALGNFYDLATLIDRIKSVGLDRETKTFIRDLTKMSAEAYKEDYAVERLITKANWQNIVENTALVKEHQLTEQMQRKLIDSNINLNYQQVSNLRAEIKEIISRIQLNNANSELTGKMIVNQIIQNGVDGINFDVLRNNKSKLIKMVDYELKLLKYQGKQAKQNYYNPFNYVGSLLGPAVTLGGFGLLGKGLGLSFGKSFPTYVNGTRFGTGYNR